MRIFQRYTGNEKIFPSSPSPLVFRGEGWVREQKQGDSKKALFLE